MVIEFFKNSLNYPSLFGTNKTRVRKQVSRAQSKFKWHTLGTMCGQVESRFTMRATSDIVNIKFRPLASTHHYLAHVSPSHKFGFKIYFEAVPPDAPKPEPIPVAKATAPARSGQVASTQAADHAAEQIKQIEEDSSS